LRLNRACKPVQQFAGQVFFMRSANGFDGLA